MTSLLQVISTMRPQHQHQSLFSTKMSHENIQEEDDCSILQKSTSATSSAFLWRHESDLSDDDSQPPNACHTSQSIPIQNSLQRTQSELQLCEDEAMADYRDYCMFHRIVAGMSNNRLDLEDDHNKTMSHHPGRDDPLYSIMRTRQSLPSHQGGATTTSMPTGICLNELDALADDLHFQYLYNSEFEPGLVEEEESFPPEQINQEEEEDSTIFELDL
jgi:hypothetical protein